MNRLLDGGQTGHAPTGVGLTDDERDALYRDCCLAMAELGRERESLFLARLTLLLMERLGDAHACREAIAEAARDCPLPSLAR